MKTLIKQYIESKSLAWSPNTLRSEQHRLSAVADLLSLDAAEFYKSVNKLYKPYSVRTLMQRAAKFKEYHNDTSYSDFIHTNARLFKNVYTKKIVNFTFEEAKRRVNNIENMAAKEAAMLMLTTGMRVHEALKYDGSGKVVGKGAKERVVFSSNTVSQYITYSEVYRQLKAVGLKPHDLRKLAATELARAGFKEADLMAVMGWSNIQTASNYLQPMQQADMQIKIQGVLGGTIHKA